MLLHTGCPHCNKAISIDLRHKELGLEPEAGKLAAKVRCEHCDGFSQVFVALAAEEPNNQGEAMFVWQA